MILSDTDVDNFNGRKNLFFSEKIICKTSFEKQCVQIFFSVRIAFESN